jgi:hypothetical protein
MLQEIFKAVAQFVKEIQAGGPVKKSSDASAQPDKPTANTAVKATSASGTAPSQVALPSCRNPITDFCTVYASLHVTTAQPLAPWLAST